ncbi:MAG TPA: glucose 1-dehydrogenase [Spongiibacteraceae bacterium]|nr:glucose 1-dehydrogenase [Spongiibacteraceae bacterium]HUH39001.1 glucose 1-dehydrogenase [Spongiibacteraceae bacterium]
MTGRVAGKVAMVTGGASGLGEAISLLLAQEGAQVVVADIAVEAGKRLVSTIREAGGDARFIELDVTSEAGWADAVAQVLADYGSLNVLVNNAGIAPVGDMEMDFALWRKVMSINLDGVFLGTREAIRAMRKCGAQGSIINISSTMAMTATPTTAAYSASKGGVRSLTKAAALHCAAAKLPIRVNSVHPGMCMTPLVEDYFKNHPEALEPQLASYPIGHLGQAVDIAQGVLYLASDESRFTLGAELVIDGGFLAQ